MAKENNTNDSGLATRRIAFDLLQLVVRQKRAFDEVLEKNEAFSKLEARDRGFVRLLVATVLRRTGQIDELIQKCLDKPFQLKFKTQDLLRLGAAQIVFLETPPHAAVDTIVTLASEDQSTQAYKGLINAVLRRLTREGKEILATQDAEKMNIPVWLWLSWRQTYGVAIAREMAKASLAEAPIDISVKGIPSEWAEKLNARLLPTGSLRLTDSGSVTELAGFNEGEIWVQDAASALPVLLLGDIKGQTVIDLCAAPGGKTAQLLARDASVISVDRSAQRLGRLKQNLLRLKMTAEIIEKDASVYEPAQKAKYVLLDAPCSATGTVRRHPDLLHLKEERDVVRLAELQGKILDHAADAILASGGMMVYAVCSLQKEEGEAQVDAFLERHADMKRLPVTADEIGGCKELITEKGDIRCLPHFMGDIGGMDGFYAVRLVKA